MEHERQDIIQEAHSGAAGGHFSVETTIKKIHQVGMWWPSINKDCKDKIAQCDTCQRLGRHLPKNEMLLLPINPILAFETRAIDFIGPFPKQGKRTGARYIITIVEYVTKWEEEEPVPSCTKEVATKFIYENIITSFGCPLTLISDQVTHFINQTIETLLKEFLIDHHRTSSYHPQANGAVESFNKTLTKGLTNICNMDKDD